VIAIAHVFVSMANPELRLVPVLLCNDLGQIRDLARDIGSLPDVDSSGRASMSIKESARTAQSNNFMGLICRSSLLVRRYSPFSLSRTHNSHNIHSTPKSERFTANITSLTCYRMLFQLLWKQ
jgi:hypothetical protein